MWRVFPTPSSNSVWHRLGVLQLLTQFWHYRPTQHQILQIKSSVPQDCRSLPPTKYTLQLYTCSSDQPLQTEGSNDPSLGLTNLLEQLTELWSSVAGTGCTEQHIYFLLPYSITERGIGIMFSKMNRIVIGQIKGGRLFHCANQNAKVKKNPGDRRLNSWTRPGVKGEPLEGRLKMSIL